MSRFNIRYFLVWRELSVWGGKYVIPAGRQEIVKDEWHANLQENLEEGHTMTAREAMAKEQAEMMNGIYGAGSHWIESDGEMEERK